MDAVGKLRDEGWDTLRLLVFGPIASDLKRKFDDLRQSTGCDYIPWVNAAESYDLFSAADLVVFPGRHSVYWEQVASLGKPMMVKRWAGTDHIDLNGNALLMDKVDSDSLKKCIQFALQSDNYDKMVKAAHSASAHFKYSEIAARSIATG